jgi:hypothetical protein
MDASQREGAELESIVRQIEALVRRARQRFDVEGLTVSVAVLEDATAHVREHLLCATQVAEAGRTFDVDRRLELENAAAEHGRTAGLMLRRARDVARWRKMGGRRRVTA